MELPRARLTLRGSMILVVLLALLSGFALVPLYERIKRDQYAQVVGEITSAIYALENRGPQGVPLSAWQSAVNLTMMANVNTFHRWHPPPIEEVYRVRAELLPKLRGAVDLQTLSSIWDRLSRTGVDGRDITDKLRPQLEACFPPGTIPKPSAEGPGDRPTGSNESAEGSVGVSQSATHES